jgi:hypothetical protein
MTHVAQHEYGASAPLLRAELRVCVTAARTASKRTSPGAWSLDKLTEGDDGIVVTIRIACRTTSVSSEAAIITKTYSADGLSAPIGTVRIGPDVRRLAIAAQPS